MERAGEALHDDIQGALMKCWGRQVAQIEAALARLTSREYGICYDCGGFIGLARLRALPFAQRCLPCQARTELNGSWPLPRGRSSGLA
jgi:DnaK suppressor protein